MSFQLMQLGIRQQALQAILQPKMVVLALEVGKRLISAVVMTKRLIMIQSQHTKQNSVNTRK